MKKVRFGHCDKGINIKKYVKMALCQIRVFEIILEINFLYKQEFENNKRTENHPQKIGVVLRILETRNIILEATIKIFKIFGTTEIVYFP